MPKQKKIDPWEGRISKKTNENLLMKSNTGRLNLLQAGMSRNKSQTTSSESATSSSATSSTTSSSSSSSSSSSDSSSSDTEHSSAVSTRPSSESDVEESLISKRGPKTTATSVPKSRTGPATAIAKPSFKGPRGAVQKPRSKNQRLPPQTKPQSVGKKPPVVPASSHIDKKKPKKSIFSPDNSTDSETECAKTNGTVRKKATAPKTPQRGVVRKKQVQPVVPVQEKKKIPLVAKASSINQRRSSRRVSEKSSEKSTDSSSNSCSASSGSDSETTSQSSKSSEKQLVSTHGEAKRRKATTPISSESDKEEEEDDGEESPRRHLTRSTSVHAKRSSLLGINKGTDSDSENGKSKRVGSRPPVTKNKMSTISKNSCSARLKAKKQEMLENTPLPPIENRKCPVDGCNSTGHLGGRYEKHFTVHACPVFHNFSKEDCKANRDVRLKHTEEREKAQLLMGNKSPKHGKTTEQRNYCNKIRDSRNKMSVIQPGEDEMADQDRQPCLKGLTPDWDLELFQEAQAAASEKIEDDLKGLPDSKGIRKIEMGHHIMEAWYHSQYPDDYNQQPKIYICQFCLKYMRSRKILERHSVKCVWRHPPGDEIYRKDKLSVWEVDGKKYKTYCQNLCLLAMLFLDHKTLYYDVEPFLFYILTQADSIGCHIIGYFSKEKNSLPNYNVSCIMTLPPYQRKGFGRLLIDFSYLLTKMEGKIGSPEKPLSDLGLISYRSYWKDLLLKYLSNFNEKNVSIKDISQEMAVNANDIVSTFQAMGMMKYWKGKHILLKRQDLFEDYLERQKRRRNDYKEIDPKYLNWRPYVPPPSIAEEPNGKNTEKNERLAKNQDRKKLN